MITIGKFLVRNFITCLLLGKGGNKALLRGKEYSSLTYFSIIIRYA